MSEHRSPQSEAAFTDPEECRDEFVETRGSYSYTELGLAILDGDQVKTQQLIKDGACTGRCMSDEIYEYDALYAAVSAGHSELVQYFIDSGADVNRIYDENGFTALSLACNSPDHDKAFVMASALLDAGAQINGEGDIGGDYVVYPLFEAVKNGNYDLINLLVKKGVSINVEDKDGQNVFYYLDEDEQNSRLEELLIQNYNAGNEIKNTHWLGTYELTIEKEQGDELFIPAVYYTLEVSLRNAALSATGYYTDFVYICTAMEDQDHLKLNFLLDPRNQRDLPTYVDPEADRHIATLYFRDGKYFLRDEGWESDEHYLEIQKK